MLTARLHSSDKDLWNEKKFQKNDLLVFTENSFIFIDQASENILSGASSFFKGIKFLILLPIRIVLLIVSITSYLALAPLLRFYFKRQVKKIKSYRMQFELDITNKNITLKEFKRKHKSSKELLDGLVPRIEKLKREKIVKPVLDDLLSEIKQIETLCRVKAYPEYNEIVLSYDEMRELNELTDLSF